MNKYINKENILKAYDKLYLVENPNRKDSLFRFCGKIERDIFILSIIVLVHIIYINM